MRHKLGFYFIVSLFALLLTSSAFAVDWSTLDPFQGKRTKAEIEADLGVMLQQGDPEVIAAFRRHIVIEEDRILVKSKAGRVEHVFLFNDPRPRAPSVRAPRVNNKPLDGVKIAVDGNNLVSIKPEYYEKAQEIANILAGKLEIEGAEVMVTKPHPGMEVNQCRADYEAIVEEISAAKVDIALAIRFNSGGGGRPADSFVSFSIGCFMKNEFDHEDPATAEGRRFRFVHALVSGKLAESVKLATHISAMVKKLQPTVTNLEVPAAFGAGACAIPATKELAELCAELELSGTQDPLVNVPGTMARNFYFHAVLAIVNVWLDPGDTLSQQTSESIAETYLQGILSYAQYKQAAEIAAGQ